MVLLTHRQAFEFDPITPPFSQ